MLKNPSHAQLNHEELIKLANISKATYYNAFKDSNFIAALETEMAELRSRNDFAVMHNLVEQAKTTTNHNMLALYQRLQGRLKEGGDKPAQIVLVIGAEGVKIARPPIVGKVIEGEVEKDDSKV